MRIWMINCFIVFLIGVTYAGYCKKTECTDKDGKCKAVRTGWFDVKLCKRFRCRLDKSGAPKLITVRTGCMNDKGECIRKRRWYDKSTCTKYRCKPGKGDNAGKITKRIGCIEGKCLRKWKDVTSTAGKCLVYRCIYGNNDTAPSKKLIHEWCKVGDKCRRCPKKPMEE